MNDTARFQHVAEVFEAARSREGRTREDFLRTACADDPDLFEEVRRLLRHHDATDEPLENPIDAEEVGLDLFPTIESPPVPERVGRYRVRSQLGLGGMGVVYLAEQDNPQRAVALKVVRPGLLTRALLRRFELEAAALGRLQHPGIAQIYDAGTFDDSGGPRPFFAMELVEGEPLTDYAEAHHLGVQERLALFVRVCEAVQHAHQRGIIHRDLKPGNILVDQTGQPKILDFGIARATDADLQVTTARTDTGRLVGTLPYMSPEQIAGADGTVDIRADVYALGVVLFELLTERLPYDAADQSFVTLARVIVEDAPVSPAAIDSSLRGDLSTIVLHALEKDPDRRYESASGLAADIGRYLRHEPVAARPATAVYQMTRFARRHTGFMVGLAAVCLAVLVGVSAIVWQSSRIRAEADTREQVAGFLREMLTSIEPEKTAGDPLTVRTLLDDASERLYDRFADAPLIAADLHETIGTTFHKLGVYDEAEAHHRRAATTYREHFGLDDNRTLLAIASLAAALKEQDRLEEAEMMLRDVLPIARHMTSPGERSCMTQLAIVLDNLGKTKDAGSLYWEIYNRTRAVLGESNPYTLNTRTNLGQFLLSQGDNKAAAEHFEAALTGLREALGHDHPDTLTPLYNLGAAYCNLGRLEDGAVLIGEAVEQSDRMLGPAHLDTLRRRKNLIRTEWQLGKPTAARDQSGRLLRDCVAELGDQHTETIAALELHTSCVAMSGDMEGAERLALNWYARLQEKLGEKHRTVGRIAMLLVNLYESWERPDLQSRWQAKVELSNFSSQNSTKP